MRSQLIQELRDRSILHWTTGRWYWCPKGFNTGKVEIPLGLADSILAQILNRWKYLGITNTSQVSSNDWVNVRELVDSTVAGNVWYI